MPKLTALQRLTDAALTQRHAAAYQYLKACIAQYSSHHPRTIAAQKAYRNLTKEQVARQNNIKSG